MTPDELVKFSDTLLFAAKAHEGGFRKYTGLPYIVHPISVAANVSRFPGTTIEMLQAALLHDVIEDTATTPKELMDKFGPTVFSLVMWLTNPKKQSGENRRIKKVTDAERLRNAPTAVKTIKLADRLDNIVSVLHEDADFAKVYVPETRYLLECLKGGEPDLWATLSDVITNFVPTGGTD